MQVREARRGSGGRGGMGPLGEGGPVWTPGGWVPRDGGARKVVVDPERSHRALERGREWQKLRRLDTESVF